MLPTESLLQQQTPPPVLTDRQRLLDLLKRERVQKTLNHYGVSREEAIARINSLTDEELNMIAGKMNRIKAGGHDYYGDDDDNWETELVLIILLIGLVAVVYFLGLLAKAVFCPFLEDCTASFLFRPWWVAGPEPITPYVPSNNPMESPAASSGPLIVLDPNRFDDNNAVPLATAPVGKAPDNTLPQDCDPRQQACAWSGR